MKFKPQFDLDLSLSEEERDMLSDLAVQWRQIHVRKHRDAYFAGLRECHKDNGAYEELLDRLPDNDRENIRAYVTGINRESSYDVDFFYWAGIEDGIRLARYVLGVKPHQEQ